MSFEGYDQHLCEKGHLIEFDVYAPGVPEVCPKCGAKFVWRHTVDETNGYDPEDPHTYGAELKVREWEDHWHEDHYGNHYATRTPLYEIPEDERILEVES